MVKVRATKASKVYNKALKEFHRIVEEGEVFEVTDDRFRFLNGANNMHVVFVEPITEEQVQEPVISEVIEPEVEEIPISQVEGDLTVEEVVEKPKKKKAKKIANEDLPDEPYPFDDEVPVEVKEE